MFRRDPKMFAYEPLRGYGEDRRAAVELPWEEWSREAGARGIGVADLFATAAGEDGPAPGSRR
jgi:hypothetical protein